VAIQRWLFPPAVSIEASADELLFEFRDQQYGREFEAVNYQKSGTSAESGPAAKTG
jgi:hypothetical protein